MKHNYTDTKLQAAIDEACDKLAQSTRVYLNKLDLDNTTESWPVEASARLDLIKSALDALPEPEPPTVDGKTPGQFYSNLLSDSAPDEYYSWEEMSSEMRAEMQSRLAAVLAAFGKQSQPQLPQLRPLAEAGEVPEGCVRYYTYKKDGEWTTKSKYRAMQDTHYIDTRLPEPEPLVTKPISLPLAESMSLRDWFAGQALTGLLVNRGAKFWDGDARNAYVAADAMIKAREVKP